MLILCAFSPAAFFVSAVMHSASSAILMPMLRREAFISGKKNERTDFGKSTGPVDRSDQRLHVLRNVWNKTNGLTARRFCFHRVIKWLATLPLSGYLTRSVVGLGPCAYFPSSVVRLAPSLSHSRRSGSARLSRILLVE